MSFSFLYHGLAARLGFCPGGSSPWGAGAASPSTPNTTLLRAGPHRQLPPAAAARLTSMASSLRRLRQHTGAARAALPDRRTLRSGAADTRGGRRAAVGSTSPLHVLLSSRQCQASLVNSMRGPQAPAPRRHEARRTEVTVAPQTAPLLC